MLAEMNAVPQGCGLAHRPIKRDVRGVGAGHPALTIKPYLLRRLAFAKL